VRYGDQRMFVRVSGGVAIPYTLPVLWITSCLRIMPGSGDANRAYVQSDLSGPAPGTKSYAYDCPVYS